MLYRRMSKLKRFTLYRCGLAMILMSFVWPGYANDINTEETRKPLWEAGLGFGGGWLPDYPASDENSFNGLPFPFLIYRGKILRIDRRGEVRGRILDTNWLDFEISVDGAFAVDSSEDKARRGMPDLDFQFGVGPQLVFRLGENKGQNEFNLNLQTRAVYSTDFSSLKLRGFVFNPKLTYRDEHLSSFDLQLYLSGGPLFATRQLMDYFYQVEPQFVTPTRSQYDSSAGYLGTLVTASASKNITRKTRIFFSARMGVFTGAENKDSPLFKSNVNIGVFGGFLYSFWQSDKKAMDN